MALSGGVVQPGPEKEEGTARDDSGDRSGGKSDTDGGGRSGASKGGGALWLSLPYVAALLPGASPDTRRQAAMSINIVLKVGVMVMRLQIPGCYVCVVCKIMFVLC